jgi:hypothetical protein
MHPLAAQYYWGALPTARRYLPQGGRPPHVPRRPAPLSDSMEELLAAATEADTAAQHNAQLYPTGISISRIKAPSSRGAIHAHSTTGALVHPRSYVSFVATTGNPRQRSEHNKTSFRPQQCELEMEPGRPRYLTTGALERP